MKPDDLNYIGNDPGAVKYGNFINYYTFHPAEQRTKSLDSSMFKKYESSHSVFCLDIGCNSGELSKELHSYLSKHIYTYHDIHMLAIDIDPVLIERAQKHNDNSNIEYKTVNIMNEDRHNIVKEYLQKHNRNAFDICFSLSVTMWLHINYGDEGLLSFLTFIANISDTIILEPQPWDCYRKAQRRVKKSGGNFPLYKSIKIRSNIEASLENILKNHSHFKIYESSSSWKRKIQSYQKAVSE